MQLPVLWYQDGLSFQCTQCGNCCTGPPGYVWVSDIEIDRFAEHLKIDRKTFLKTYCRLINGEVSLKERRSPKGEYDCVFLKEIETREGTKVTSRRVCTVYDVRPLQCRTWPFWDGLLESREAWESAKDRCPGIDRGKHYSIERIKELNTAEDWPDAPPGSK